MSELLKSALTLIITANFLNRHDPENRWLTREKGQRVERDSVPRKQIRAENVRFDPAGEETPFGCSAIASTLAEKVEYDFEVPDLNTLVRLHFNYGEFVIHDTNTKVETLDVLYLLPDGTMYAELSPADRKQRIGELKQALEVLQAKDSAGD